MKLYTLLTLPSLFALTLAAPDRALDVRQAGTTIIPACATATATQAAISETEIAEAVAGCQCIEPAGANDTRNDIVDGICKPFTLLFARGTGEDPNLGNLVGPPFVCALNATFGTENVAVQGVNNYPADDAGFCAGGSSTGSQNLAQVRTLCRGLPCKSLLIIFQLIEQTMTQCPKTKLCVSGYSQGAQVVHNAAKLISAAATNFINSVVLFGDPDDGQPVGSVPAYKVNTDCHVGDNICAGGDMILLPHLSYCHDVYAEAAFALARSLT